jgi:hypothetical protein
MPRRFLGRRRSEGPLEEDVLAEMEGTVWMVIPAPVDVLTVASGEEGGLWLIINVAPVYAQTEHTVHSIKKVEYRRLREGSRHAPELNRYMAELNV